MSETNVRSLERTIQTTNEWLLELDDEFGWDDRERSYKALRAVLHTLRDRLQLQEATQLAAQLPLVLKGVFYDGWNPEKMPVKMRTEEEFVERIVDEFGGSDVSDPGEMASTVFRQLDRRVSTGEIEDVRTSLPESIRALWPR